MALKFDTHDAIQKLRGKGHSEDQAEGVVELVRDATDDLVTEDYLDARLKVTEDRLDARLEATEGRLEILEARFQASQGQLRADLYRALWIQGGVIIGAVVALVKLL